MHSCTKLLLLILLSGMSKPGLWAQDIFSEPLLKIDITFVEKDWYDILINARNTGDNRRLSALVQINNSAYPDVQVRFKGNSSFYGAVKGGVKKLPLNLKASDEYPFAGGYETLKLANNYRDPSAVRELLSYQIAADYVPVPQSTYAIVTVNGEYLGVYTATEDVSYTMTNRYFCGTKKGLVQGEPDFDRLTPQGCPKGSYASLLYLGDDPACYYGLYEVKDSAEWDHLIRLTRVLKDSHQILEDVLDVHRTLWMHAINNVLVNLDSYLGFFCHNYYLYRDREGIYHPLLWDLNLAFGGFHVLREDVQVDFATMSPIVHERYHLNNRPLITELMKNRLYRRLYFSMMRTILDQWIINGRYIAVGEAYQDQIRPHMRLEKQALYSISDFEKNLSSTVKAGVRSVPGIEELMTARMEYLNKHPLLKPIQLKILNHNIQESDASTQIQAATTEYVQNLRVWYRLDQCGTYYPLQMTRIGDTSNFEVQVIGRPVDFYFELEGEETANLWPLRAPAETMNE